MRCLLAALLSLLALAATVPPVAAQDGQDGQEFVAVALHDVVDHARDLDADGMTTDRLVAFLEWLAGNGFTAITLDDIERARTGQRPLPARAILLTADDGYRSLYTRIYPLAMAYRMPVVAGLVVSWLDTGPSEIVRYGDLDVPRSNFISWDEAREMQASGWIEFASHSHALHGTVIGNPQGNPLPAAVTRQYDGSTGYESAAAWRARVETDLRRSRERLAQELGRPPRAMIWPYGRYSDETVAVARALGFQYALTLQSGPASVHSPLAISRFLPGGDLKLVNLAVALRFQDPWPPARRLVCMDPSAFASADPEETNARLGRAIERLRRLGATHVVIDALARAPDGSIAGSWFPTSQLPLRADLLSRLAAQMRNRGGASVVLRLPHADALAALGTPERVEQLFDELAAHVSFDALLVEQAPAFAAGPAEQGTDPLAPWKLADERRAQPLAGWSANDMLALRAFRVAESRRPGLELFWLAGPDQPLGRPAPLADLTLVPLAVDDPRVPEPGLKAPRSRRVGVWWEEKSPPAAAAITAATRRLQLAGTTTLGWCPDDALADLPPAQAVAPAWSANTFPLTGGRR